MPIKKTKFILLLVISVVILISVIVYIFWGDSLEIKKSKYSTSEVTMGNVCRVIEAVGETESENEVLILSPNSGIVKRVLRLPGSMVLKGEVILTLDETAIREELEATKDELEILYNSLQKIKLSAKTVRIDLEHDLEVKKLKIASLKAELEDEEKLLEVGGISQARIDKTQQELVLAEKELRLSVDKNKIKLQQLETEEKEISLRISIKEKQAALKSKQIDLMVVRSPGTGIILEVRAREGENKMKNELLVRISENTRLKIKGKISEKYDDFIRNGRKVYTEVDSIKIPGVIGNIKPELEDGNIQFDVFLQNPQNEKLKINQKVKLLVVIEEATDVMRIVKGDYFKSARSHCNIIDGSEIYTREIKTGILGNEYVEIVDGLTPGEVVINSNFIRTRK